MHLYTWLIAHAAQIAATMALVALLVHAVPESVLARFPRLAHAMHALVAAAPDILTFLKRLWGIWTGLPFPLPIPAPPPEPRASVAPPLPVDPKGGVK